MFLGWIFINTIKHPYYSTVYLFQQSHQNISSQCPFVSFIKYNNWIAIKKRVSHCLTEQHTICHVPERCKIKFLQTCSTLRKEELCWQCFLYMHKTFNNIYLRRDIIITLCNPPQPTYFNAVLGLVQSSNRMVYPTSCPSWMSNSSDTRWATLMAATLLGWVQATALRLSCLASKHHWGIYSKQIHVICIMCMLTGNVWVFCILISLFSLFLRTVIFLLHLQKGSPHFNSPAWVQFHSNPAETSWHCVHNVTSNFMTQIQASSKVPWPNKTQEQLARNSGFGPV